MPLTRLLAVVCLGLHLVVVARGGTAMLAMTVPMLTFSALCLLCAAKGGHLMMAGAAAVMVGLHALGGHDDPLMRAAVALAGAQGIAAVVALCIGHRTTRWRFAGRRAAGCEDAHEGTR